MVSPCLLTVYGAYVAVFGKLSIVLSYDIKIGGAGDISVNM